MTLTEFLLARIDEDERYVIGADCICATVRRPDCPERLVDECEMKRRIVERHTDHGWLVWTHVGRQTARLDCGDDCTYWLGEFVLKSLAAVYDSHPDYDPEWTLT